MAGTLPSLAQHHRVIAVDLPGFGASEPIPGTGLASTARWLDHLCSLRELGAVDVVGHSLGTMVACEVAAGHPGRAASLCLLGGPISSVLALFRRPVATVRRHPQVASFLVEALTGPLPVPVVLQHPLASRPWGRRLAMAPYMADPAALPSDLARHLLAGVGASGALPTLRAGFRADTRRSYRGIAAPTSILNGTADRIVSLADLHDHARRNRVDRLRLLDDTGHIPMIERPRESTAEMLTFLAAQGGRS